MVCIAWRASPAVLWFSLSAGFYAKLTFKYYFSPIRRLGVVIFRKVCAQISIALSRLSNTLYGTKYSRFTDKGTQAGHISARALAGRVTEIFFSIALLITVKLLQKQNIKLPESIPFAGSHPIERAVHAWFSDFQQSENRSELCVTYLPTIQT